jgi:plastocyanin
MAMDGRTTLAWLFSATLASAAGGCFLYPALPVYDDDVVAVDALDDLEPTDAGLDAGDDAPESGPDGDAGDAGAADAVHRHDAPGDAPPDIVVPPMIWNDCTYRAYIDRSAAAAVRTVEFGGTGASSEYTYAPACIVVAPGQSVQFEGNFGAPPLSPGISETDTTAGSPNNPITRTADGTSRAVAFPARGIYPYFCETHQQAGMAGAVWVR